jgi:hypothetical protein
VLGSIAGAVLLVVVPVFAWSWSGRVALIEYLSFVPFLALFLLGVFLVVGWPLFLVIRSTRWFRLSLVALAGAVAGIAASGVFGSLEPNLLSLAFAVSGTLAACICWWFMVVSPNPSFKRTRLRRSA